MAAIYGAVGRDGRPVTVGDIAPAGFLLESALSGESLNIKIGDSCAMGVCGRSIGGLSILADTIERPLSGIFGVADVFLTNRQELIRSLGSDALPDSSLIGLSFERWKGRCPERMRGSFAFAIWDECEHRLALVRDQNGMRPLYLLQTQDRILFASTPVALAAMCDDEPRLDTDFLRRMLADDLGETSCSYLGVERLPPATIRIVRSNGSTDRRYWRLERDEDLRFSSDGERLEAFQGIFDDAVAACVDAGPAVSFMSGGLDSTSVVASIVACQPQGTGLFVDRIIEFSSYLFDRGHATGVAVVVTERKTGIRRPPRMNRHVSVGVTGG